MNAKYTSIEDTAIPDFSRNNHDARELLGLYTNFISNNRFEDIRLALEFNISFAGGDPKQITTYYALELANPRVLPFIITGIVSNDVGITDTLLYYLALGGCSLIYQSMGAIIGTVLNTEVQKTTRFNNPNSDEAMNQVKICKRNVFDKTRCRTRTIAYSQNKPDLESVIKLSTEEENVLVFSEQVVLYKVDYLDWQSKTEGWISGILSYLTCSRTHGFKFGQ